MSYLDVIKTVQKRDNLSWASAYYEVEQTKKAIDRNRDKGYDAQVKVLESYLGLEEDYLPYFEMAF